MDPIVIRESGFPITFEELLSSDIDNYINSLYSFKSISRWDYGSVINDLFYSLAWERDILDKEAVSKKEEEESDTANSVSSDEEDSSFSDN